MPRRSCLTYFYFVKRINSFIDSFFRRYRSSSITKVIGSRSGHRNNKARLSPLDSLSQRLLRGGSMFFIGMSGWIIKHGCIFFWRRNVVKRRICYENVCRSVCPSVCYTLWVTPKRFKISKYALYHTIERCPWFLEATFRNPEFRSSPLNECVKKNHPPVDSENLTNTPPAIYWKRCEIGCKLVLFTIRKSHTGFRLVLKVANDLEPRNGRYFASFRPKRSFRSFGNRDNYVKLTETRSTLSATKMSEKGQKIPVFGIIWLMNADARFSPIFCENCRTPSFHYSGCATLCPVCAAILATTELLFD